MPSRAVWDPAGSAPLHNVPGSLKRVDTVDTAQHHTAFTGRQQTPLKCWTRQKKNQPRDDSILTCRLFCARGRKENLFFFPSSWRSGWKSFGTTASSPPQLWYPEVRLQRDVRSTAGEHGYILRRGELDHQGPAQTMFRTCTPPHFERGSDVMFWLRSSLFWIFRAVRLFESICSEIGSSFTHCELLVNLPPTPHVVVGS